MNREVIKEGYVEMQLVHPIRVCTTFICNRVVNRLGLCRNYAGICLTLKCPLAVYCPFRRPHLKKKWFI